MSGVILCLVVWMHSSLRPIIQVFSPVLVLDLEVGTPKGSDALFGV